MKKLIILAAAMALAMSLSTCAHFAEPEPDYVEMMMQAAREGDEAAGREAEELYIQQSGEAAFSFDELYLLSRAIHLNYGHYRNSAELRMCAGEVILNRMASPEYPDSMEEVVFLPDESGREAPDALPACCCPDGACVEAAGRLLSGERMLEPSVVRISRRPQQNVYAMFCDHLLGNTYFYKSEHPELYEAPAG